MKKPMIIMLIAVFVLFGLVFFLHMGRKAIISHYIKNFQQQAVVISTAKVKETNWTPHLTAVGSLTAVNGVNVSTEVAGMVVGIFFKSGQSVNKGDILVQLDDLIDQQTLNTNAAQLNLDKLNYERQLQLAQSKSTPQSDVDQAQAKMLQSQASVATAEVQIDKKKIKAPFSGKIGIRQINLGEYVTPGQPVVTLQAMDPLYVDFALPEQYLPKLRVGQEIQIMVDAYPKKIFKGKIEAINSAVDISTRSIQIRAVVPNPKTQLYPGIFANVAILLPEQKKVLTIPQTGVAYSLHGDTAFVITPGGKDDSGKPILRAKQRNIVLGEQIGNQVIVKEGLKEGQEVVSSGQLKVQPDAIVEVNNK